MWESFFGFKKTPFGDSPDAKQLFASAAWQQVKTRLEFLTAHPGAGLLTGEVGAGKSTAARVFAASLHTNLYKILYLHFNNGSALDLLRQIALALDLAPAHFRGDGVTWREYEKILPHRVDELHRIVQVEAFRATPSRRVYIPKADGRQRPLGIASIEDKIVQQAVVTVLGAIYEEDFLGFSYGFRPGRGQHDALDALTAGIKSRKVNWIVDADIRSYLDSIPHDKLMACLRMRVVDRSVLKLIRMWLETPVMEPAGRSGEPEKWSRSKKGTPQGGVISPLLANVYLHWFDKLFHRADGPAQWAKAKLVRYADDFVVLARYQTPRLTGWIEEKIEKWLDLEINRDKTRVVDLKKDKASLDFLGYTFRWDRDLYGSGKRYLNVEPSKKSLQRERERINELTDRSQGCTPIPRLIERLNRHRKGWANYFSFGYPRKAFGKIDWHLGYRLANHLKHHRSQRPYQLPEGVTYYQHFQQLGVQFLRFQSSDSR